MSSSESPIIRSIALRNCCPGISPLKSSSVHKSRTRWRHNASMSKQSSKAPAAPTTAERFEHTQVFFDTPHGQLPIGEIPPIPRAALAAVGKTVRVALVCGETETVSALLQRLNAALGKAAADNIVIDEVLPEIKRRR